MTREESKDLIVSLNQRYWYGHQSPKTCRLGSDGVGHDFIHPMDKLQAACRNGFEIYNSALHLEEEKELKEIELGRLVAQMAESDDDLDQREIAIKIKRCERQINRLEMEAKERWEAFDTYAAHVQELLPVVKSKYDHFDDAIAEIWAARVAYSAAVKSHPLGQELKIALMDESQKHEVLNMIGCPTHMDGHPLPVPDGDAVMQALDKYTEKKRLT